MACKLSAGNNVTLKREETCCLRTSHYQVTRRACLLNLNSSAKDKLQIQNKSCLNLDMEEPRIWGK